MGPDGFSNILRSGKSAAEISGSLGLASGMVCLNCKETFGILKSGLSCPRCHTDGVMDFRYDYDSIAKILTPARLAQTPTQSMWRYLPLLPVRGSRRIPPVPTGWSPVIEAASLGQTLGMDRVWLKDEGRNPAGSIHARSLAVAITRAREESHGVATCGGIGATALAAASFAASVGMRVFAFVADETDEGLLAQISLTGAEVFAVEGTAEDALRLSWQCANDYGWYNANAALNPYMIEGLKTAAFELGEHLQWTVPDWIVVPVAEGNAIAAVWKGYREMKRLGWISLLPKMVGVQATGCSPIFSTWKQDGDMVAVRPSTIADSMSVGAPRNWRRALAAIQESGGTMAAVSDREILQAMNVLGERSGIVAGPGSAAALAGLVSLLRSREIPRSASALLVLIESGLRHAHAAIEATGAVRTVAANFEQVRQIVERSLSRTPF